MKFAPRNSTINQRLTAPSAIVPRVPGLPRLLHCLGAVLVAASLAGQLAGAEGAPPRLEQVIVVFKTHFDIGYTDMATNVVRRYRTGMIDQALAVCDQNRDLPPAQRFTWTIPGWPLQKIVEDWQGQTPERKQRVWAAFKEGRFVVHALPFTTHTELLELEDLTRGMAFASRLCRAASLELPRDAKMTDVPCHSWVIPTLLRRAGVDFLHLGCNAASSSPQVPILFWWEGPDGSRVLTMYTAESYGTGLLPPANWPYKTWLALIHTGDNHGPPQPAEVKGLLAEAAQKLPGVKVRIGRLSDFADALLAEPLKAPVVRGDMPDTWIHGPLSDPAGAKLARNLRPLITAAELLYTHLRAWGVTVPDPAPAISAAWEQSLLYGEHTWGGGLYWITAYGADRHYNYGNLWRQERAEGRFNRLESSWAEHTAYIETADRLIQPVLKSQMDALARAVNADGRRIVVFNPLPWQRDGLVQVEIEGPPPAAVTLAGSRELTPVQTAGNLVQFVARNVPPTGYQTYLPLPTKVPPQLLRAESLARIVESPFFRAKLDPKHGVVRSLVDRLSGRELVDTGAPYGFGQFLYERFDADRVQAYVRSYVKISAAWATNELGKPNLPPSSEFSYKALSPKDFKLQFVRTPVSVTAVMSSAGAKPPAQSGLPCPVTTRLTLYRDLPYADLEVTLHDKPADPWPEAGWICLPVNAPQPRFRLGRLGGIVDPATDLVRGANHNLFGINTGVVVTDPRGRGLGLCPLDSPLVSLGKPGCWEYSQDFVPEEPVVFVNLFNNQWTTNFRLWNQGQWSARVRIWAVDRYSAEPSLITPSLEARYPLLAAAASGPPGALPASQSGLAVSHKGVLVSAFTREDGGDGLMLRLWEQAGGAWDLRITLPAGLGLTTAVPADLRARPTGNAVNIRQGAFGIALMPFEPKCFILH